MIDHLELQVVDMDAACAFYRAALAAGGVEHAAPRLMPHIHPYNYAGFVRDPDGHLVEYVCHAPG